MANPGKFLYFAYGSNLSTERIHLNNPSAIAKGPALLKGFKLNFNYGSNVSVVKTKQNSIFLYLNSGCDSICFKLTTRLF